MEDLPVGVIGQPAHKHVVPGIRQGQGHVHIRRLATVELIAKVICLKPQPVLMPFVQVGMCPSIFEPRHEQTLVNNDNMPMKFRHSHAPLLYNQTGVKMIETMYTLAARRILIESIIIMCLLNLMAW